VFRKANAQVPKQLLSLKKTAQSHGQPSLTSGIEGLTLQFYCECSNEKCRDRIDISIQEYLAAHENKKRFILLHDHEVTQVERVVASTDKYIVVEKHSVPPDSPETLKPTGLDKP
jgi:hypothetical protein